MKFELDMLLNIKNRNISSTNRGVYAFFTTYKVENCATKSLNFVF